MRGLRTILFLFGTAASLLAGQGSSAKTSDPCGKKGDDTACFAAQQQGVLDAYGLTTAERHLAARDEIRRALVVNDYSQHIVAVQFIRSAGREPTVEIYAPTGKNSDKPRPAISASVPERDWEAIADQSRNFDRSLLPLAVKRGDEKVILICSHGWTYIVETTDPDAEGSRDKLRRRVENTCDRGLVPSYANFLADTALRLLPPCHAIDRREYDSSERLLAVCSSFSGDRLAAAKVHNRLSEFRGSNQSEQERLRNLFAGAMLDWNGERISSGAGKVWQDKTASVEATFFPKRLRGENSGRVLVEGALEYWMNEGERGQLWVAPVTMTWELDQSIGWRMKEVKVGEFVRTDSNCNPNRLTGGGNC